MDTQIPRDDGTGPAEAARGEQGGIAAPGAVLMPDAWLERRLRVFERALTALEARAETMAREHALTIARMEERIRALMGADAAVRVPPAARHDLQAAISTTPVAEPGIPVHDQGLTQTADAPPDGTVEAALVLPVQASPEQAPRQAVSREEMARILQGARQAARAGEESNGAPHRLSHLKLRLRWLSLGCLALVALFVGAGLMLEEPARAVQIPTGSGTAHRHVSHNAFQRMIALADYGEAKAQAGMALAYLRGAKTAAAPGVAMNWAGQAAANGNPIGQYLMGVFYSQGEVVKADPGLALRWFAAAAGQGNLKAMHNLGVAYAAGRGTQADAAKAARWFRRAAERGYVDSAFNLAVLYERGDGVPQNGALALQWYEVAARAGDAASRKRAGFLRDHIPHAQVARADRGARTFVRLTPLPDANRLPAF